MPRLTMPRAAPDHPRPRTNHRPPPPTQQPALSRIASPSATHELRNTDTISRPARRLLGRVAISTVIPTPQPSYRLPNRHSGASRNPGRVAISTVIPPPQPSFRRKPESMPCGHIHRHSASPSRHSGASRNPGRAVTFTVIPDPQPSFRRKPESRPCGHIHRHTGSPSRHSGASRNPGRVAISTVIPAPPTVIPAQAGIQGVWPYSPSFRLPQPSFRRKPESMLAGSTTAVGDYDAGFRLAPE